MFELFSTMMCSKVKMHNFKDCTPSIMMCSNMKVQHLKTFQYLNNFHLNVKMSNFTDWALLITKCSNMKMHSLINRHITIMTCSNVKVYDLEDFARFQYWCVSTWNCTFLKIVFQYWYVRTLRLCFPFQSYIYRKLIYNFMIIYITNLLLISW